jgi:distribution and morphology protein 31
MDLTEGLQIRDVLVTMPTDTKPIQLSIYTADIPRLRWSWLLYDILTSRSIIGSYDNSLFTYQPPQRHMTGDDVGQHDRCRQLRVDSLNVDRVTAGLDSGPLTWIQRGRLAVDIMVTLPAGSSGLAPAGSDELLATFWKTLFPTPSNTKATTTTTTNTATRTGRRLVQLDVDLRLSAVKAQLPLITTSLSLFYQAIVRPTVAYLNEHRHHTIPLSFSFSLDLDKDLRGAWGLGESGIADGLGRGVGEAFAELAGDTQKSAERMRRVGLWSVYSLFKQAVGA